MKIAFISTNNQVPWGGSEELWSEAALELKRSGIEVAISVAEWKPYSEQIKKLSKNGIKTYNHIRLDNLGIKALNKFLRMASCNFSLIRKANYKVIINEFKPDLVVISQGSFNQGYQAFQACIHSSTPFITLTQLVSEYHTLSDISAGALLECLRLSSANFFLSPSNIKLASRLIGEKIPKARIVRNPYKVPSSTQPINYPSQENGLDVACVASLAMVHKGQDNILEILSWKKWKERNIRMHFYGTGPNSMILEKLALQWDLSNVFFHGFEPDIENIWKHCQALLLASHMEGLPIVVIEAMICCRAVIAPNVGCCGGVIEDDWNGYLAQSPNILHLESALDKAWLNQHRLREMGVNSYEKVTNPIPKSPEKIFAKAIVELVEGRIK